MKTITTIAALAAASAAFAGGTTLFEEGFEGAEQFTTSTAQFSDGSGDFWGSTQNITFGSFVEYNGADGNFFAGMDLDGEGATLPLELTTDTFNISGFSDLTFSVDLAEDDDGTDEDWDDTDFVAFEYSVDGGAFTEIFSVVNDGSEFNSPAFVNGVEVTDTFSGFGFDLTGVTGSTLALRVVWNLNSGDEDLAIDNLVVSGIPSPGAAALFGLAGLSAARRRRA